MIRIALGVFVIALLIVVTIALRGDAGAASLTWLGWEVQTTAAAGVLIIGLLALAATMFWQALVWILQSPARTARANADKRRRQAAEVLTRGFVAAAAGDGAEARRLAQKAADLTEETPDLVRILAAQAAEAAGDHAAAKTAYGAMLGFPDMRLAAHRGLMQTSLAEGDMAAAQSHAQAAYDLPRTAAWAWRAVLEGRLHLADWTGALAVVQSGLDRKIVSPLKAERAKAALQTAADSNLESLMAAAKARPDFTPAAVIAAHRLTAEGRPQRAAPVLEAAWRARPHPAVWMAYRDLRNEETPRLRAARLAALAEMNPKAPEAAVVAVEQALIAGDPAAATAAATALDISAPTRRLAGLMARVATAGGRTDEARAWVARGAAAPDEPDWSDLDEKGRAFAYSSADWARVIIAYTETGDLIHPRHERGEHSLSDLPSLPASYEASAPFVAPAEAGDPFPPIVDDEDFGQALQPSADPTEKPRSLLQRVKGR